MERKNTLPDSRDVRHSLMTKPIGRKILPALMCIASAAGLPAETLLIADKTANTLVYFDTDTRQVTHSVPVGANPHEVVVTRDGRFAITSNSRSNTVSVVDLQKHEEVERLESPLFQYPHGMAVHPNGETLYLTSERNRLLLTIDLTTRRVAAEVPTGMDGSHMVVLSPGGERAYLANRESGTVSLIETGDPSSIHHATAGDGAEGMALSHDGRRLVVANRNDNDLYLFDGSDLRLEGTIPLGEGPVRVAIAPDDRRAFVTHRASAQVHVVDLMSRTVTAKIAVGEGPGGMAFDSKGALLYVANTSAGTISVVDLATSAVDATHVAGEGPDGMWVTR